MKVHAFEASQEVGMAGEERVLHFLRQAGYEVEVIGYHGGFDKSTLDNPDFYIKSHRVPTKELVGKTLEVKTDTRAHETGNVILELVSNVGTGRQGWAYSTVADYLGYLCTGDSRLIIIPMSRLRERLKEDWHSEKVYSIANRHFTGISLAVGREEVAKLALFDSVIP